MKKILSQNKKIMKRKKKKEDIKKRAQKKKKMDDLPQSNIKFNKKKTKLKYNIKKIIAEIIFFNTI